MDIFELRVQGKQPEKEKAFWDWSNSAPKNQTPAEKRLRAREFAKRYYEETFMGRLLALCWDDENRKCRR